MYKIKRIISLLIVLVMLVTMLPMETLAKEIELAETGAIKIEEAPGVYLMGEDATGEPYVAVIWVTDVAGTGYITYKYNNVDYTVYDMKNGVIRTNDTVHVVTVPLAHLSGNSYKVNSREVTSHSYATTNYGSTASTGPYTLKAYDNNPNDFDVLVLTDTHGDQTWTNQIAKVLTDDPDLVVFSGDIVETLDYKTRIEAMFNIMGSTTGGQYPIVYARGNHETRGARSTLLLEYFPTETGEFYFDFSYGPMWGVVMDTAEDKRDDHAYYGTLANYDEYRLRQEAWLRTLKYDKNAKYRVGIFHIGRIGDLDGVAPGTAGYNGPQVDFRDSIVHLGIQFGITGHFHDAYVYTDPNSCNSMFTSIVAGGGDHSNITKRLGTLVEFEGTYAYVTSKNTDGNIVKISDKTNLNFTRFPIELRCVMEEITEPLEVPERGTSTFTHFNRTTQNSGVNIATSPAVFETGGDWYNIVWTTDATITENTDSGSVLGCTGYVEYEYNGKTYQVFDEVAGYRRSYSNIHTVKVPKEHLNNNKYKVGSFLVLRGYEDATAKTHPHFKAGGYVESPYYVFEDRSEDKAVNIIACPDIRLDSNVSTSLANVKKTIDALGTSPAVVVLNGDTIETFLSKDADITKIVQAASAVSGGIHPVVFSRGESECRGQRASDLMRYFPTATGELYYSVDIGEYTLINLDTAEDARDDAKNDAGTASKYNGRVNFKDLKDKQKEWLNEIPDGKLIVVSHIPLNSAPYFENLESELKNKGAVLALDGHVSYDTSGIIGSNDIYTITGGGYKTASSYSTVSVLVSDNYAHINSKRYSGSTIYDIDKQKTVDLTTGNEVKHGNSEQPELINGEYILSKPEHILWLSENCKSASSFSGNTYKMANDIDMKLIPFTPIGGNDVGKDDNGTSYGFSGTFDGNGYSIKNLNINSDKDNVGFFGVVRTSGVVKNLTIDAGFVKGKSYVGALAGYTNNKVNYVNCYTDVVVHSNTGSKVGGIVGFLCGGSTIESCANFGNVNTVAYSNTGGITGQINGSTKNAIYNSYNRGNIIAHHENAAAATGGIFGYTGSGAAEVKNCYNAAAVTSAGAQGAIFALNDSASGSLTVSNCYYVSGFNGAQYAKQGSDSWTSKVGSGTISKMSQSSMKSQSMANTLNSEVYIYNAYINDGYPSHKNSYESEQATLVFKYKNRSGVEKTVTKTVELSPGEARGCEQNGNRKKYPITQDCIAVMKNADGDVVFAYTEAEKEAYLGQGYEGNSSGNRITYYAPIGLAEAINKEISWEITSDNIVVSENRAELTAIQSDSKYTVTAQVGGRTYTATGKYGDLIDKDTANIVDGFVAPEKNSKGELFSYWAEEDGTILSYSREYLGYRITETKTIEAVYGAKDIPEWAPSIEDITVTREYSDDKNYIYTDYLLAFHNKDGKSIEKMIEDEDANITYGLLLVRDSKYTYNGEGEPVYPKHDIVGEYMPKVVNFGNHAAFTGSDNNTYNCYFYDVSDNTSVNNFNRCRYYVQYDVSSYPDFEKYTYAAYAYVKVNGEIYVSQKPANVNLY